MKDTSSASTRHSRHSTIYPKKRPSPHGISKAHKSPSHAPPALGGKTPRSTKAALLQQRQREARRLQMRYDALLLEEEYREEIQYYMHDMERFTMSSAQTMDQQPEIRWHMRPLLVDFLVEVHFTFRLRPETLYLTLNIIDRYVSRRIVYIKHYQLVGCAALWIAAKFEDAKERVPTVQDLCQICRETYEESAFIQMETHVLETIEWTLGHPTAEAWLRILCCGPYAEDPKVQHVARFLMEITLFYREFVNHTPSTIALAALTLARYICDRPRRIWEETEECLEVVELIDRRLSKQVNDLSETLVKKYSYAFYSKAATFVVQYYLRGSHFVRHSEGVVPMTPTRSPCHSVMSTPTGSSTSRSDISDDDMPLTPSTPAFSSDPFSESPSSDDDKENFSSTFEPAINKHRVDSVPEQFLPHDFIAFGRSALHNVDIVSP